MIQALVTLQMLAQRAGERLHEEQEGATAVEYGLLVALIAAIIVAVVAVVGVRVQNAFVDVCNALTGNGTCPSKAGA